MKNIGESRAGPVRGPWLDVTEALDIVTQRSTKNIHNRLQGLNKGNSAFLNKTKCTGVFCLYKSVFENQNKVIVGMRSRYKT